MSEIERIAGSLRALFPALPFGIEIKVSNGCNILISNYELGFAITSPNMEYAEEFVSGMMPELILAISQIRKDRTKR